MRLTTTPWGTMFTKASFRASIIVYLSAVHGLVSADVGPAPVAGPQPTQATEAPVPAVTSSTPAAPGARTRPPTPAAPLAPAFDPDAVCAPFPDVLSSTDDPVADFPCNSPSNSLESACAQYPGCAWIPARSLCSGAFNPDACAQFTVQQCNASPFCTGADNAVAVDGNFAGGIPPPLVTARPPDGGGTAGPNADPLDPLDYEDSADYSFTSTGTAGGDGVSPRSGTGTGVGSRPEFGINGTGLGDGEVTVASAGGDDYAEPPFELPESGTLLDSGGRSAATGVLLLALIGPAVAAAMAL